MADAYYDNFLDLLLDRTGSVAAHTLPDFATATLEAHLIDITAGGGYTLDTANDQDEADLGTAVISQANPGSVTFNTVGSGILDCATITFTSVSGSPTEYMALSEDAGGATSANPLICIYDAVVTPTGGNIDVVPNDSGLLKV